MADYQSTLRNVVRVDFESNTDAADIAQAAIAKLAASVAGFAASATGVDAAAQAVKGLVDATGTIGPAADKVTSSFAGIASTVAASMVEASRVAGEVGTAFAAGFTPAADAAAGLARIIGTSIATLAQPVNGLAASFDTLSTAVSNGRSAFADWRSALEPAQQENLGRIGTGLIAITDAAAPAAQALSNVATKVVSMVPGLGQVAEGATTGGTAMAEFRRNVVLPEAGAFAEGLGGIYKGLGNIATVAGKVTSAVPGVGQVLTSTGQVFTVTGDAILGVGKALDSQQKSWTEMAATAASSSAQAVKSIFELQVATNDLAATRIRADVKVPVQTVFSSSLGAEGPIPEAAFLAQTRAQAEAQEALQKAVQGVTGAFIEERAAATTVNAPTQAFLESLSSMTASDRLLAIRDQFTLVAQQALGAGKATNDVAEEFLRLNEVASKLSASKDQLIAQRDVLASTGAPVGELNAKIGQTGQALADAILAMNTYAESVRQAGGGNKELANTLDALSRAALLAQKGMADYAVEVQVAGSPGAVEALQALYLAMETGSKTAIAAAQEAYQYQKDLARGVFDADEQAAAGADRLRASLQGVLMQDPSLIEKRAAAEIAEGEAAAAAAAASDKYSAAYSKLQTLMAEGAKGPVTPEQQIAIDSATLAVKRLGEASNAANEAWQAASTELGAVSTEMAASMLTPQQQAGVLAGKIAEVRDQIKAQQEAMTASGRSEALTSLDAQIAATRTALAEMTVAWEQARRDLAGGVPTMDASKVQELGVSVKQLEGEFALLEGQRRPIALEDSEAKAKLIGLQTELRGFTEIAQRVPVVNVETSPAQAKVAALVADIQAKLQALSERRIQIETTMPSFKGILELEAQLTELTARAQATEAALNAAAKAPGTGMVTSGLVSAKQSELEMLKVQIDEVSARKIKLQADSAQPIAELAKIDDEARSLQKQLAEANKIDINTVPAEGKIQSLVERIKAFFDNLTHGGMTPSGPGGLGSTLSDLLGGKALEGLGGQAGALNLGTFAEKVAGLRGALQSVPAAAGVAKGGIESFGAGLLSAASTALTPFTAGILAVTGAVAILAGPFKDAADAVLQFIGTFVDAAAQLEKYQVQFTVLTGSVDNAKLAIAGLQALGQVLPFNTDELIQANKDLLVYGVSGSKLSATMMTMADVAAMTGHGIAQVGMDFGRMFASIKDGTGEMTYILRQLERMGALSGGAREKIKDLEAQVKAGTLSMSQGWDKILAAFDRTKGTAEALAATFSGMQVILANTVQRLQADIGQMFLPVLSQVGLAVNAALGAVDAAVRALEEIFAPVLDLINNLVALISGSTVGALKALSSGLEAVASAFHSLWDIIEGGLKMVSDSMRQLGVLGEVAGNLVDAFGAIGLAILSAVSALAVYKVAMAAANAVGDVLAGLWRGAAAAVAGEAAAAGGTHGFVYKAAMRVAAAIGDVIVGLWAGAGAVGVPAAAAEGEAEGLAYSSAALSAGGAIRTALGTTLFEGLLPGAAAGGIAVGTAFASAFVLAALAYVTIQWLQGLANLQQQSSDLTVTIKTQVQTDSVDQLQAKALAIQKGMADLGPMAMTPIIGAVTGAASAYAGLADDLGVVSQKLKQQGVEMAVLDSQYAKDIAAVQADAAKRKLAYENLPKDAETAWKAAIETQKRWQDQGLILSTIWSELTSAEMKKGLAAPESTDAFQKAAVALVDQWNTAVGGTNLQKIDIDKLLGASGTGTGLDLIAGLKPALASIGPSAALELEKAKPPVDKSITELMALIVTHVKEGRDQAVDAMASLGSAVDASLKTVFEFKGLTSNQRFGADLAAVLSPQLKNALASPIDVERENAKESVRLLNIELSKLAGADVQLDIANNSVQFAGQVMSIVDFAKQFGPDIQQALTEGTAGLMAGFIANIDAGRSKVIAAMTGLSDAVDTSLKTVFDFKGLGSSARMGEDLASVLSATFKTAFQSPIAAQAENARIAVAKVNYELSQLAGKDVQVNVLNNTVKVGDAVLTVAQAGALFGPEFVKQFRSTSNDVNKATYDAGVASVSAFNQGIIDSQSTAKQAWQDLLTGIKEAEPDAKQAARLLGYIMSKETQQGLASGSTSLRLRTEHDVAVWKGLIGNLAGVSGKAGGEAVTALENSITTGRTGDLASQLRAIYGPAFQAIVPTAAAAGSAAMQEIANVRQGRSAIDSAIDQLNTSWGNRLSRGTEVFHMVGILASRRLAQGLRSGDPQVRADAAALQALVLEQLDGLNVRTKDLGGKVGQTLAVALRSHVAAVRDSAKHVLEDVIVSRLVAAGAKVDEVAGQIGPALVRALAKEHGNVKKAVDDVFKELKPKPIVMPKVVPPPPLTAAEIARLKKLHEWTPAPVVLPTPGQPPATKIAEMNRKYEGTGADASKAAAKGIESDPAKVAIDAATAAIASLVDNKFGALAKSAQGYGAATMVSWGAGMMSQVAVVRTMLLLALAPLKALFAASSPPKEGPFKDIVSWGEKTATAYGDGWTKAMPVVTSSIESMLKFAPVLPSAPSSMPPAVMTSSASKGGSAGMLGRDENLRVLMQIDAKLDLHSRLLAHGVAQNPRAAGALPARNLAAAMRFQAKGA